MKFGMPIVHVVTMGLARAFRFGKPMLALAAGVVLGCPGATPASAQVVVPADLPVIILYDQEGRPGEWAFTQAPKISLVSELLTAHADRLVGRADVSLRRTSIGTSGDPAADCAARATDAGMGDPLSADALRDFTRALAADGNQGAPAAALADAVADLAAVGGGHVIYFTDTISSCDDDPLWVAETAPENVTIDVVAIGAATELHELSELALASGGAFHLMQGPGQMVEPGAGMIDDVLPAGSPDGGDAPGEMPPGEFADLAGDEGETRAADIESPLFSGAGAGAVLTRVDTGVDLCPAFDLLSRNLLDYANGTVAEEPVALQAPVAIAFIIDASGSMAGQQGNKTKMAIAKEALGGAVRGLDGSNAIAALWSYGFDTSVAKTPEASCPNTGEIVAFGRNQGTRIARTARGLTPYGYTPLAASLRAAGDALQGVEASRRFAVLISDGEETCGGDPVATAAALASAGIEVNTYVVGYDLDADQARELEAVATAGGTDYLDAADGPELARVLKELVTFAVENTERIAPSCSNPVRGGDTPATAVLLPPGIYTVGELLDPGEYRYYRVATDEGQRGLVRGLIQAREYVDTAEGPRESSAAPAALTIETRYPDGRETAAQPARDVGIPGTSLEASYIDTTGEGFIFGLGDNYRRLPPESLFQIEILPFADGGQGDAGAAPDGTDVAIIGPGGVAEGHFGAEDVTDVWSYDPDGPRRLTASLSYREGAPKYRLTIYDAASGERIGRGNNAPASFDATGPVRIEIENRAPKLRPELGAYTITVTDE